MDNDRQYRRRSYVQTDARLSTLVVQTFQPIVQIIMILFQGLHHLIASRVRSNHCCFVHVPCRWLVMIPAVASHSMNARDVTSVKSCFDLCGADVAGFAGIGARGILQARVLSLC